MEKKIRVAVETVIMACVPILQEFINKKLTINILSCLVASVIAVAVIIVLQNFVMKIIASFSKKYGRWYEHMIDLEDKPYTICEIKYDIFSDKISFSGTNYYKNTDLIEQADHFYSSNFSFIENGFIYTSRGGAMNLDRSGLGKFYFPETNKDGLKLATGFFIDTTVERPMINKVVMYRANTAFYRWIGLDPKEGKRNEAKTLEKFAEKMKKQQLKDSSKSE